MMEYIKRYGEYDIKNSRVMTIEESKERLMQNTEI